MLTTILTNILSTTRTGIYTLDRAVAIAVFNAATVVIDASLQAVRIPSSAVLCLVKRSLTSIVLLRTRPDELFAEKSAIVRFVQAGPSFETLNTFSGEPELS